MSDPSRPVVPAEKDQAMRAPLNTLDRPKTGAIKGIPGGRPLDSRGIMNAAGPEGGNLPTPAQPPTARRLDVISMAAGVIGLPGSEYGPCIEECAHLDCASTRARAASICPYCGGEIGYDVRFYFEGDERPGHPVHALCAELEAFG